MNAMANLDDITTDERRNCCELDNEAHRRLRDTRFNRLRWPAFLTAWAVGGGALLLALLYWAFS